MDIEKIKKQFIDSSPRQIYHLLRSKIFTGQQNSVFTAQNPVVFVLSTGRSGTETINALFNLANNVFTYHEPLPTLYRLSKLAYKYEKESLATELLSESFLTARADLLKYSLDCGKGYVETSPQVTFLAPIIQSLLPEARFIHLVRDPQQVVRSGMRRKWFAGHLNDQTRIVPDHNSPHGQKWDAYTPFQKNLWLWAETNRWILEFTTHVPPDGVLQVHAEDVFRGDESTLSTLFKFIGAPLPSTAKISKLLSKKFNAQKTGLFPEAGEWSAEQKEDLLRFSGKIARSLGYDL